MVSQDIQANAAVGVDVGVVDSRRGVNLRRLEGVVGREVYGEEEDTSSVRGLRLDRSVSLAPWKLIIENAGTTPKPLPVLSHVSGEGEMLNYSSAMSRAKGITYRSHNCRLPVKLCRDPC